MRKRKLLPLLILFFFLLGSLTPIKGKVGVLLIAHGSPERMWNGPVQKIVKMVNLPYPVELGFLEYVPDQTIEQAVAKLRAKGADEIIAIPLFISSYSNHIEEIKYILKLRKEPPQGAEKLHPLRSDAHFILTPAFDAHPLIGEILRDRVKELSVSQKNEIVVLTAYGAETEENLARWNEQLASLATQLKKQLGLKDVKYGYIFKGRSPYLREVVKEEAKRGRVIVIPIMVSAGFFTEKRIPQILKNLSYRYNGSPLAPDRRLARWVEVMVNNTLHPRRGSNPPINKDCR